MEKRGMGKRGMGKRQVRSLLFPFTPSPFPLLPKPRTLTANETHRARGRHKLRLVDVVARLFFHYD